MPTQGIQPLAFDSILGLVDLGVGVDLYVRLPRLQRPVRAGVSVLVSCAVNVTIIWYLGRRKFRQFADEFVAEREKEKRSRMMQKVSEKKISEGKWD